MILGRGISKYKTPKDGRTLADGGRLEGQCRKVVSKVPPGGFTGRCKDLDLSQKRYKEFLILGFERLVVCHVKKMLNQGRQKLDSQFGEYFKNPLRLAMTATPVVMVEDCSR